MCCLLAIVFVGLGRSPYGERGLKFKVVEKKSRRGYVALLTESVD